MLARLLPYRVATALLVVLALQLIPAFHLALAQEHTDKLLNILKKRPRGKSAEAWNEERREAARELGRLKEKRAVPTLLQIVQKERFDVILEIAIDALGDIGDKRAITPLRTLLNDPSLDAYARDAVAGALRKLGEEGPKEPTRPVHPIGIKPTKPEPAEPPAPEPREPSAQELAAQRLAKLEQSFGGLQPLDLTLPADLLARSERWDIVAGAADVRWDKRASLVESSASLTSRARLQVERRGLGYTIEGNIAAGFRVTDTQRRTTIWDFNHSLNVSPEVRLYPFRHDLPLFFFQLSGGAGYGLDLGSTPTMYERRLALAGTISAGVGPGYGRIYDVGAKLRLRRLKIVLKKAGLLTADIDSAVGNQLIMAWYQLRNRIGSFWQLGYTLDILARANLLNIKDGIDPAAVYRIIRILDDPQLLYRPEGMMFRLGYGYTRTMVKDGADSNLGFVYATGEHAWQIGTTRALESSLRFYFDHLSDPARYGVTARSGFSQYLYNSNYDPLGALSAFVSAGLNNQAGASFSDGGVGYQVMAGGSYARLFNSATQVSLSAQLGVDTGSPLFLVSLQARYGIAYGSISPM